MQSKIISKTQTIKKIQELRKENISVGLVTGSFDVVHLGHIKFLKLAKKQCGGILFIGLENDESLQKITDDEKPYNKLEYRLEFLAELECVDFVFGFDDIVPSYEEDGLRFFVKRYKELSPNYLLVPKWDPYLKHKKAQSELANIELKKVNIEYEFKYW